MSEFKNRATAIGTSHLRESAFPQSAQFAAPPSPVFLQEYFYSLPTRELRAEFPAGTPLAITGGNQPPTMKNLLTLSSLIITGGYIAAEIAESAGVSLPAAINAENALIAFTVVFAALTLFSDYAPKAPRATAARALAVRAARTGNTASVRRQGYAIRRGAEAARLANPPARVVLFPKTPATCCDHAA
jgi:hypothetical protein